MVVFSMNSTKVEEIEDKHVRHIHLSEHLSNERTHLAYLRTSIAVMSFGITINRFSLYLLQSEKITTETPRRMMEDTEQVGFGMVIFGMLLMLWAGIRYTTVSRAIDRGDFRPSKKMIWIITIGVLLLGASSLVWLFRS
jgi:putative membrane protein